MCSFFLQYMMGIFQLLRQTKHPVALKVLNQYLKFCARLVEANVTVTFLKKCIELNRYPKHYSESLRRNHVYPTIKTLKRQTINLIDTLHTTINNLEFNIAQRQSTVDNLPDELQTTFKQYVNIVTETPAEKKKFALLRSLDEKSSPTLFPQNPERYVHNLSDIMLDKLQMQVLSLGPEFCDNLIKDDQLDCEIQFENLYSQTTDLKPTSSTQLESFKTALMNCCYDYRLFKPRVRGILTKDHRTCLKRT